MPDFKPEITDRHLTFIRALGRGKASATTKDKIKQLTGLDPRMQRQIVEDLYHYHIPIVILGDGKGYFIADSYSEIKQYSDAEEARKKSMLTKCYHISETAKQFKQGEDYATNLWLLACNQMTI